jgi:hypothetical protein
MQGYRDIPLAKDLNKDALIDIQTETGKVQLIPFRVIRDAGKQKWCVSIEGICRSEVNPMTQCYVHFKEAEIGGNFSKMTGSKNGWWDARFETIISIPEFWGEQP